MILKLSTPQENEVCLKNVLVYVKQVCNYFKTSFLDLRYDRNGKEIRIGAKYSITINPDILYHPAE